MTVVTELRPGLWQISLPFLMEEGIVGSYLLAGNDELALIDPGPGSMDSALLEAVHTAGFIPQDITHILLTHIHLDHAGGAGLLLQQTPNARVYVHSIGAPHIIDPTRVVASAARIYGERMQQLWGPILAIPADKITMLEDGDTLAVAGRHLQVFYTPGHAIHHVVFYDQVTGELFTGDVAGVRLQGIDYVRPPTPPPDLDLESWTESIKIIRDLHPEVLYLGHFGPTRNVEHHLSRLQEKLYAWGELVLAALREGKDERAIIDLLIARTEPELRQATSSEQDLRRYEIATNYPMTAQGYIRYWNKKHPEKLSSV